MKHRENSRMYEADEGKFVVRISDGKIMGDDICLGDFDSIDNYREDSYTEESRKAFFDSIRMKDPKIRMNEHRRRAETPVVAEAEKIAVEKPVEVKVETADEQKKKTTRKRSTKKRSKKTTENTIEKEDLK